MGTPKATQLTLTTECMIRAGLRERHCNHSTKCRTGNKAEITG